MAVYEINNLTIQKGTDFDETFNVFNEDGTPLNANGNFSAVSKIKKYPSSPTAYSFNTAIDILNSAINISMTESMTAELPTGRCYFDVLLIYGSTTKKIITGTIIVQETTSL
jgi:hypothetical protein